MTLAAEHVGVRLGDRRVLDDVTAGIPPGSVVGIVGPNGAGKSTLLRTLALLHRPIAGVVRVGAEDLAALGARDRARRRSMLPQETEVGGGLTVRRLVELGRYAHHPRFGSLSRTDHEAVDQALAVTGTTPLAHRQLAELSGGQRQLALLAKTIAQDARTVLLDEPVSALDLRHQLEVIDIVRRIAAAGAGVAMVLHDLTLAARACDTLCVLAGGRIVARGTPPQVLTPALLADVWGVRAHIATDPRGCPIVTPLEPVDRHVDGHIDGHGA